MRSAVRARVRALTACVSASVSVGLALGLATQPRWALAETATTAETVVVTGSREALPLARLVADVTVIEGDALRESRADSLADLLRREAGVQVFRNGGPGQATGLSIRGAASQQTLVLVDGVRVGSATLGITALESLGLGAIERVEVLRGPASSLYGSDAVGGVVHIITRGAEGAAGAAPSDGSRAEASLGLGGYGAREASAHWRGAAGPLGLAVSLTREQDEGVSAVAPGDRFGSHNPDRDGHTRDSAQLRAWATPAPGHRLGLALMGSRLRAHYDAAVFLPPSFAPDPSPDFLNAQDTAVASLDWRVALGQGLSAELRLGRSSDDTTSGAAQADQFRTVRTDAQAQLSWRASPALRAVLALEARADRAQSSSYLAPAERRQRAWVLEATGSAQALSWQADLRRDEPRQGEAITTGRLGARAALGAGFALRALAGSSYREPSFNDLVFPGYGVPTLRPERGQSRELGLAWQQGTARLALTAWRNPVRDLVAYQPDAAQCPPSPAYAFGCAANVARARLQGLSLSAAAELASLLPKAAGTWQLRTQLDRQRARDGLSGAPLPRRADTQATLAVDGRQGAWRWGASLAHLGERPDGGVTLKAETTLDLSASWQFAPQWRVQARLDNATDTPRVPGRDYQGLGRQAWLLLRWELRP